MFKINYHTHTFRCGHAGTATDEEYVAEAVKNGFETLGFSDHIMLPGFEQPKYRGNFSLCQDYYNSINNLKEKYKNKIQIVLGFEAESFPKYFPYYSELINDNIIDFLILGNHMSMNKYGQIISNFGAINTKSDLYLYKELAIKAIKTNLFSIFAHPDIFLSEVEYFDKDCYKISQELIQTSKDYDVPLEINLGGIRSGLKRIGNQFRYHYPTVDFFEIVSKLQAPCLFGIDAHNPKCFSDEESMITALHFARSLDLIVVEEIEFKTRNKLK